MDEYKIEFDINKKGHFLYYGSDKQKREWEEALAIGAKRMADQIDKDILDAIMKDLKNKEI